MHTIFISEHFANYNVAGLFYKIFLSFYQRNVDFSIINLEFTYISVSQIICIYLFSSPATNVIFSNPTQLKQQRLYDDQSSLRLILLGNLNFNMSLLCLCVLNSSTSEQAKNVRQMVLRESSLSLNFFLKFSGMVLFCQRNLLK